MFVRRSSSIQLRSNYISMRVLIYIAAPANRKAKLIRAGLLARVLTCMDLAYSSVTDSSGAFWKNLNKKNELARLKSPSFKYFVMTR